MTVLIAYASKHGATQEIAERIAEKLRQTLSFNRIGGGSWSWERLGDRHLPPKISCR